MTTILRKRKAVSPVIATVILIAVAVALGIAVAFWASGLTSSFSKYEKLGVNTQYAISGISVISYWTSKTSFTCQQPYTCWQIILGGQNTGSSDATITQIQINGVPYPFQNITPPPPPLPPPPNSFVHWNSTTARGSNTLSVPSGASFSIILLLMSSSTNSTIPGKTFASGQTIQVTLITAAGNNYPASIVLP